MKTSLNFFLALVLFFVPILTHNQTPSPDVVLELNKVSLKLKRVWFQKIKDSKIYDKMADYQKSLTTVFETAEFLKQTKSILELLDLIEAFACRIRMTHEMINNNSLGIPSTCGFDYKYQKAVTGFNMALDLSSIIMDDIQMSIGQRMKHLESSKDYIISSEEELKNLEQEIIKFNY
ncbi:MAG: hypothetical protein AB8F74_19385 [Saprospiraceae bacterium]